MMMILIECCKWLFACFGFSVFAWPMTRRVVFALVWHNKWPNVRAYTNAHTNWHLYGKTRAITKPHHYPPLRLYCGLLFVARNILIVDMRCFSARRLARVFISYLFCSVGSALKQHPNIHIHTHSYILPDMIEFPKPLKVFIRDEPTRPRNATIILLVNIVSIILYRCMHTISLSRLRGDLMFRTMLMFTFVCYCAARRTLRRFA